MTTTTIRSTTSFRLPLHLLEGLKSEAKRQHRSVNSLVEVVLLDAIFNKPNAKTASAIAECKSGVELENFDPNELDKYMLHS